MLLSEEESRDYETDPALPCVRFLHELESPPPDEKLPFSTGVLILILLLIIAILLGMIWWSGGAILAY